MLGSPIWNKNLEARMVYFNGKTYFGNSGYSANGGFVSYNFIQKRFYKNTIMDFDADDAITGEVGEFEYNIEFQQSFQRKLMSLIEDNALSLEQLN